MAGVSITGWPMNPKSFHAWSSLTIKTTLGGDSVWRRFGFANSESGVAADMQIKIATTRIGKAEFIANDGRDVASDRMGRDGGRSRVTMELLEDYFCCRAM